MTSQRQLDGGSTGMSDVPADVEIASLEELEWFHPNATRHIAESLLMQNGNDGSFLLRPGRTTGSYALSIRGQETVKHYPVTARDSEYDIGYRTFSSLKEFVDHFHSQPLIAGKSGIVTLLKYPYPRHVDELSQYETVRVHVELGSSLSSSDNITQFSSSSKEGFLTKRGAIVKNWKERWFTLNKMQLCYFKTRADSSPIRALDLNDCAECSAIGTFQNHDNCFRVVFPWRVFYFSASTPADAKDWIDLICWKIGTS